LTIEKKDNRFTESGSSRKNLEEDWGERNEETGICSHGKIRHKGKNRRKGKRKSAEWGAHVKGEVSIKLRQCHSQRGVNGGDNNLKRREGKTYERKERLELDTLFVGQVGLWGNQGGN